LILGLRTSAPVALTKLDRLPPPARVQRGARYLCLALRSAAASGERRLCLGGARRAHRRAGLEVLDATGKLTDKRTLAVKLKRPDPEKLVLAISPSDAGLVPHRYRWRLLADFGSCGGLAPDCAQSLPAQGERVFRLRPVRPVGCTGGSAGLVTNGSRESRVVALTFDDGPSDYTPSFLAVLRREHVHASFFEIGQEMAGRESTMRRILREGDEIGNHTMHHTD
jgi:hypothetical protein